MPKICIDMILYDKWENEGYKMDRFVSAEPIQNDEARKCYKSKKEKAIC